VIGDWLLQRPIGGALHSAFFARRRVDAQDRGRYDVSRDATPGGKARLTGFRVKWQKRIRFDSYTGGVLKG
jgi:hypothetical protein